MALWGCRIETSILSEHKISEVFEQKVLEEGKWRLEKIVIHDVERPNLHSLLIVIRVILQRKMRL